MDAYSARLAPPPRPVPLSLKAAMMTNGHVKYGTAMFVPAMIFFWWVAGDSLRDIPFVLAGSMTRANAAVLAAEDSGWRFGSRGGGSGGTRIYRYRYRFADASGQSREGVAYTTGDRVGDRGSVEIEYSPRWPWLNRIIGGRASPTGLPALTSIFFAALSLMALGPGVRRGRRAIRLLSHGDIAAGLIRSTRVKSDAPNNSGGREPLAIEYDVEFVTSVGHRVVFRATADERLSEIRTGVEAPVIYDPRDEARAMLLTSLPRNPTTDQFGQWQSAGAGPLAVLLVVLLAHVAQLLFAIRILSEP
jgi:hypothetical protein